MERDKTKRETEKESVSHVERLWRGHQKCHKPEMEKQTPERQRQTALADRRNWIPSERFNEWVVDPGETDFLLHAQQTIKPQNKFVKSATVPKLGKNVNHNIFFFHPPSVWKRQPCVTEYNVPSHRRAITHPKLTTYSVHTSRQTWHILVALDRWGLAGICTNSLPKETSQGKKKSSIQTGNSAALTVTYIYTL